MSFSSSSDNATADFTDGIKADKNQDRDGEGRNPCDEAFANVMERIPKSGEIYVHRGDEMLSTAGWFAANNSHKHNGRPLSLQ